MNAHSRSNSPRASLRAFLMRCSFCSDVNSSSVVIATSVLSRFGAIARSFFCASARLLTCSRSARFTVIAPPCSLVAGQPALRPPQDELVHPFEFERFAGSDVAAPVCGSDVLQVLVVAEG